MNINALDMVSYRNDTFEKEDIFTPVMLERLKDSKTWIYEEVITTLMGRCWMVCYQKEVRAAEFVESVSFHVNTARNYQVGIYIA